MDTHFRYTDERYSIRGDIPSAFRAAWNHIASPGSVWTGVQRVEIARQSRIAWECPLCAERKAALSPNAVAGSHDSASELSSQAIDAVHRITTDPGRLTKSWFDGLMSDRLTEAGYVEIIGIVSTITSIDTFCNALSLPVESLPEPLPGEPTRYRPERLKRGGAWVPLLMENDLAPPEADVYTGIKQGGNVLRCMSLVPNEVRNLFQLSKAMYMDDRDVVNFQTNGDRAISRDQMEFIAARVSFKNDCFY